LRRRKNNKGDFGVVEKEQWRILGNYGEDKKYEK